MISASYTEPVGKNKLVEINYAYTNNQNNSDKKTNNYDTLTGKYEMPNPQQTNYFTNSFIANRVGGNFRVQQKEIQLPVGRLGAICHRWKAMCLITAAAKIL